MNIRLFQINLKRDQNRICFMAYEDLERFQGTKNLNCGAYDKVFEGEVEAQRLDDVYEIFNLRHPEGYRGRSLSVSDVIEVTGSETIKPGFYFCDSVGYQKVEFDPSLTRDATQREKISVLLVKPGKYPETVEIDRELEAMQQLVGGYIEAIYPFDLPVALVCNEEGKLTGLPLNRALYGEDGKPHEIISGNFFLAYASLDDDHFSSLPEELAEKYADQFKYPERFYRGREGVIVQRYTPDTDMSSPQNVRGTDR